VKPRGMSFEERSCKHRNRIKVLVSEETAVLG